jgi:iron complex outermembrane receptor protein
MMNTTPLRIGSRVLLRTFAAAAALCSARVVCGQGTPATTTTNKEDAIVLPQFTITETPANPYQSAQALSASRVALPIQDIPQTISVVTSDLIQDTLGQRMLDVAKYVTPIVESSLTMGSDRYQIRGYQVSHDFVDGTEISGQDGYSMSAAPYNIERIEIIKGPNAILVPGGSPGGQMNPITKAPAFLNRGSATLELAQYFGTAISFDVDRVLTQDKRQAARFVGAYWHHDGYTKNKYRYGYLFAPSYSFQLNPENKVTLKAEIVQNRETNDSGLPLDPAIGSNGFAQIAPGLPRDWSFGDKADTRHRQTERISGELISNLSEHVTSRLYLMADHVIRSDIGGTNASIAGLPGGTGGSRNPNTGLYEPGVLWSVDNSGATAVVTSTAAPIPAQSSWIYNRNYGRVYLTYNELHAKNDFAGRFDFDWMKSTTILGWAANRSTVRFIAYPAAARPPVPANNLGAITYPSYPYQTPTVANGGGDRTGRQTDFQGFVYENMSFWQDRVLVAGGFSRFSGKLSRIDNTGLQVTANPRTYKLNSNAKTLGLTFKPIKEVALFYGYNDSGGQMPGSLSAGNVAANFRVAEGDQKEFGVKVSALDNTFTASIAHFDIAQKNYPAPNSEYYILVSQGITPPPDFPNPLYLDLTSKGWEVEFTYSLNKNLSVLGNYSWFKLRQPFDVKYRAVPDENGAIYVDYRFTEGPLNGFGFNVGADYKGEAPGDLVSPNYTTTKPLPGSVKFVAQQPSFKVADRTIVNLGVSYRKQQWTARLQVANVFDKEYIQAALNRNSLYIGEPRAIRSSFTYKF